MKQTYFAIWDNGGKTIDRYTVAITREGLPTEWYVMSENANFPNGVNQRIEQVGDNYLLSLDIVPMWELPSTVQSAIKERAS